LRALEISHRTGSPQPEPLATLHSEGKVSVFPAIGYEHPDQSHFTSRHYYEIGELEIGFRTGWLGRYLDLVGTDDNPLQGLSMDGRLSPMIATADKPVAAIDSRGTTPKVHVIKGGRVAESEVQTGVRDEAAELVEIQAGVAAGDTVLLGSAQGVTPGSRIRVLQEEAGR